MDYFFRRKKGLKALITLCLILVTLLMFQKWKDMDTNIKDEETRWCDPNCDSYKNKTNSVFGNYFPPTLGEDTIRGSVSVTNPASWDVNATNCSADLSVKKREWFWRVDSKFHQFLLHRHCRYFPMLINHPDKCSGKDIHLLMVIKSVTEQHDRREAVRRTWGKERVIDGKKIKTLFLLGSPTTGKDKTNLQKLIQYEDRIYGDILQWDFMDTFFNLTLKEVNFLKWLDIYCASAKFIFKGDDDVFVNTKNLMELIDYKTEDNKIANLFVGDTISRAIPIRNRQSKYYIPRELYDKPYPPYVGGGGFLMSSQLAKRLFMISQNLELYPIDDVFLGMCLRRLGVAPEKHRGFRTFGITKRKTSPMNNEPCFYKNLIVIHKLSPEELLRMWAIVHRPDLVCAVRTIL